MIKNSIKILAIVSALFFSGCASKPKLRAYVPPKENVIVKERVVYRDGGVKSDKADILKKYEDQVSKQYTFTHSSQDVNSYALVIGINSYKQNTPVEFADLSALAFKDLANKTFGIPKENIITLLNEEASSGQLKAKIEQIKELAEDRGNLYIYFAGHGIPGKDGSSYILPYDMSADSMHLEPNLKLDNIYKNLSSSKAKKVFVFMDSCFSGKDDRGELLYKGVAPILRANAMGVSDEKIVVFTAGLSNDFANDYQEKRQRLFSYYLISEIAKGNKNINSIYKNIKSKVKRASLLKGVGYKQVPQIYGDKNIELY